MRIANELEGFIIDKKTRRLASSLNGQRIDQAIFNAFNDEIRKCISTEEYVYHFEIKNPKALDNYKDSVAELNNIISLLRYFLSRHGLDIVFQAFPPFEPTEEDLKEENLTDNAKRLVTEQGWSLSDMSQSLVSGWQTNIDLPQDVIDADKSQEFIMNFYNFTHDQYDTLVAQNANLDRVQVIQELLQSSDQGKSLESHMSYAPGGFSNLQEMYEYIRLKTGKNSLQDAIDYKSLHSMTIKPKSSIITSIVDMQPQWLETRSLDSFDPSTLEGKNKMEDLILEQIEMVNQVEVLTFSPSSPQLHHQSPMAPNSLDQAHLFHPAE